MTYNKKMVEIARQRYPEFVAKEITKVQPLDENSGLVFQLHSVPPRWYQRGVIGWVVENFYYRVFYKEVPDCFGTKRIPRWKRKGGCC